MNDFFDKLSENNFYEYAVKNYNNFSHVTHEEFIEDLNRFKYIKKLLKRHETGGELKYRLILNHIIILSNVFGILPTLRMLFYKCSKEQHTYIKTFCTYLSYFSYYNVEYLKNKDTINIDEIQFDSELIIKLRNIDD